MIDLEEKDIMFDWNYAEYDNPLVTISCIAYNQENYITDALDSFLMQKTDFVFEIVIHDDASTDNTATIIREYEKKYPHIIRAIYEEENQYSKHNGSLRRIMVENAKGKYTALCEGDDYWTDCYKLKKQIDYMEMHPECSMTFHAVNFTKDDKVIGNDRRYNEECDVPARDIIIGGGIFCATASLCFKSEYYAEQPEFKKVCDVGDYPLQILFPVKGVVHYFPEIMGVYRRYSNGSWTAKVNKQRSRQERHHKSVIECLKLYDIYSEQCFTDAVKYAIVLEYIELYKDLFIDYNTVLEQMREINLIEDKNELLEKLKKVQKKVFIKTRLPKTYLFLSNLKRLYGMVKYK